MILCGFALKKPAKKTCAGCIVSLRHRYKGLQCVAGQGAQAAQRRECWGVVDVSEFSNLLSSYIRQKGYSIRSLAKRTGIPSATLTKICSGTRSPKNQRERVERIVEILMLTPEQNKALAATLEKEIVGPEYYESRANMRAFIEGIHCTVAPSRALEGKTILPILSTAEKKADVYVLLRSFLEDAAQNQELDIYLQYQDPILLEELTRLVRSGMTRVRHILTLTTSDGKSSGVDPHNLEKIRYIEPLFLDMSNQRGGYQAFYYYERTAAAAGGLLQFPNVLISEHAVLQCTADYTHAIYLGNRGIQRYFKRLFHAQLVNCRPLTTICSGIQEQIVRYTKVMQAGNPQDCMRVLGWQPCLLWAVTEQEVLHILPENVPFRREYLSYYLPYLRQIQQWKELALFFSLDGLNEFAQTGFLQELPEEVLPAPLALTMRIELLQRLLDQARVGRVRPHIVREEKMRVGQDAQLISYGADTILLASLNHQAGNRVCFVEELSANWSALDFLENLEDTDWVLSVEETCAVIKSVIDVCVQKMPQDER